jgi:pyruvate,orthophosphate dikinase
MGRPCVAGASRLKIDLDERTVSVDGTRLEAGDMIAIDGTRGFVTIEDVPLVAPEISEHFDTVLDWADAVRRLGVRANVDTPADARRAREFGAEGIGLCRTEHMFMEAQRQPKMRAMIMADTEEDRRAALDELLPLQRGDFEGLFEAMEGHPVTIRLLDPPLHEFLPSKPELLVERERLRRADDAGRIAELEHVLSRVRELEEVNPMLGTRGCRLAILYPEVYEMQVRAIVGAALAVRERGAADPAVEIMIPLVGYEQELEQMRALVERAAARAVEDAGADPVAVSVGTMIELPRACMIADLIAAHADFFSFGTNDLTQTVLGFSRDDAEGGFLTEYLEAKIVERSPFETLDVPGVGSLVRAAAASGRIANPDLKLGICGEHGGDPDSVDFFDQAKLDYVSCSPFRVPIARVAAAQAAIRHRG